MKPNVFYHSFYVLSSLFGANPESRTPTLRHFAALLVLSIAMTANVYSLIMLLELTGLIGADLSKWSLFVFLLITAINYLWMVEGKKLESILHYYDKKYHAAGSRPAVTWVVVYIIFSLGLVVYLADRTRDLIH